MEDEKIRQLLKSYTEKEMDLIVPEEMEGFDHDFSKKFDRKMKKIMIKEKCLGRTVSFTRPVRRAVLAAAAAFCLLLLGNLSADVFNIHPWKIFGIDDNKEELSYAYKDDDADLQADGRNDSLTIGISGSRSADKKDSKPADKKSSQSADKKDSKSADIDGSVSSEIYDAQPDEIDGAQSYAVVKRTIPSYVPEGLERDDYQETNSLVDVKWRGRDDSDVSYIRTEADGDAPASIDEEYQSKESIEIAGYTGFLYKKNDKMWIDWKDTKYNHYIDFIGIDDENEIIKMAESLYQ